MAPFRRCSVDDSRIRIKTAPFWYDNGLVWTGPTKQIVGFNHSKNSNPKRKFKKKKIRVIRNLSNARKNRKKMTRFRKKWKGVQFSQFYYRDTIKLTRCFARIQFWLCFLTQAVLLYSRIWWYLRTFSLLLSRFLGCPPLRERCVASQKKAAEETWELSSKLNILSRSFRPRGGDDSSVEKATAPDVHLIFERANCEGNAFSMKVNNLLDSPRTQTYFWLACVQRGLINYKFFIIHRNLTHFHGRPN